MAPVIWGLDLSEFTWSKFGNKNMWSTTYHLRRTKFIVYQLAMILCVVSESLGTAALSDYVDLQDSVRALNRNAVLYNNDIVGAGSYNIFTGVYVAIIFGAAFFFDLIWPERHENKAVKLAWRICSVLAIIFIIGDLVAITTIVASRSAYIYGQGINSTTATSILQAHRHIPLAYRHYGKCVASVVFLWLGFPAVIASTVIMWMGLEHDKKLGPLSTHARVAREKSVAISGVGGRDEEDSSMDMPTYNNTNTRNQQPQAAYAETRPSENHQYIPNAQAEQYGVNAQAAAGSTSYGAYAPYAEPALTTSHTPYRGTWI